jgi:predicted deacylase
MQRTDYSLLSNSLGSQKTLTSFHYGSPGARPKVYIQASLHAEELPGMLAAHHLRALLEAADAAGEVQGEVILVPVANPIGLAQRVDHKPMGRFDLDTSENFNRHYPDFAKLIDPAALDGLGADPVENVAVVRRAIGSYLASLKPNTELESLRHRLLTLAHDADFVLDLHCDCEAVVHFYTEEACWPQFAPLAHLLGSRAILLAKSSGGASFDECLSSVWWQLSEALAEKDQSKPLPQSCHSTTVELRGELDLSHALAQGDAQAIYAFMQLQQVIASDTPPEIPGGLCEATPLAGSETLSAPAPGVVVFAAQPGQMMKVGDLVAEVIDPIENHSHRVLAGVDGVLYARVRDRYITSGGELAKIAGATPFRTGLLLGA